MAEAVPGKIARSLLQAGAALGAVVSGRAPQRCTQCLDAPFSLIAHCPAFLQWYFETFCGVDKNEFEREGLEELDADAQIRTRLNGFVKPYGPDAAAAPRWRAVAQVVGLV